MHVFHYINFAFSYLILKRIENEIDDLKYTDERGHQEILNREEFSENHFINARMTPNQSLLSQGGALGQAQDSDDSLLQGDACMNNNSYPMMIRLIDDSMEGLDHWQSLFDKNPSSNLDDSGPIPTMASIAAKVAREEGTKLDIKQIVTYESICATFLLQLVNDGEDDTTSIGSYFKDAATAISPLNSNGSYHDNSCKSSLSSNEDNSSTSSRHSLSDDGTNSSRFSRGSLTSSCVSNSSIRSNCSSLKTVTSENKSQLSSNSSSRSECSSLKTVTSEEESQLSQMSMSSETTNQSDYTSSDPSDHSEYNVSDLNHHSYLSQSDDARTSNSDSDSSSIGSESTIISNDSKDQQQVSVRDKLYALGAKEQLIMFLTGSAGAGKTTAVKLAQRFCFEFCRAVSILWNNRTFLFTAYTGSAASCFGGITICKAAFLNKTKSTLDQDEIDEWKDVRVLVIDEISFMKDSDMIQLDRRLKQCSGDRLKPFGGYSIIFAGDFRQLEPSGAKPHQLLFSRESSHVWCDLLNAVVILESDHRFKEDPEYGKLLQRMWAGELSMDDRKWLNERVIGSEQVPVLPDEFTGLDAVFACPKNTERNSISAGNFKRHVLDTHPSIHSLNAPPDHTIIIEANINSTIGRKNGPKHQRIGGALRHRILTTCGDAKVLTGSKRHVDPALCLYVGAHVLCIIDNENLSSKVPRGNGTLCRVIGIKLKDNAQSYRWKNYYNKKVNTALASDVEWIELEHYPKSKELSSLEDKIKEVNRKTLQPGISQRNLLRLQKELFHLQETLRKHQLKHRFRLSPQAYHVTVRAKPHCMAVEQEFRCKMQQLPINSNDATTGHKLQGMSKDVVIISSWPTGGLFKNWEYVVLSRVRTRSGLYMFEEIDMKKSFKPSPELASFFERAKEKEQTFLEERKKARQHITFG